MTKKNQQTAATVSTVCIQSELFIYVGCLAVFMQVLTGYLRHTIIRGHHSRHLQDSYTNNSAKLEPQYDAFLWQPQSAADVKLEEVIVFR